MRDLSHELDLALSIFGPWKRLVALGGNFQRLDIETDEAWSIIMETEKCPMVSICMNYFDQPGNRSIRATTDDTSIIADLSEGRITSSSLSEDFVVKRDDTYQLLHQDFIEQQGQSCTLTDGIAVVRLMDAIEKSNSQRNWIEA
ncbi:oxidoreductase domain-containing protein [Agrobacterium albertimagni AOL15]|uniref:Oxidoreductase domain-containing protein n=1 Tax=Agrobacterium albertimagni AOL15 TaxID=1156935 RepID=K2QVV3_9HYPH|nr:oxidoreductase domain-containing protein [Agrobacterium albertimagni AOL15]